MSETPQRRRVTASGLELSYLEQGDGEPVLLLHGWPTSSELYRRVMPPMARRSRVLALDLPGFGASAKPLDVRYDFPLYARAIDGFLAALGIDRLGLVVHDLGGPVGLHWACHRPERVTRLALLNTLVYPPTSPTVFAFVTALYVPGLSDWLTGPRGLAWAMRAGVADPSRLTGEAIRLVQGPFAARAARRALRKAGRELSFGGFRAIGRLLPKLTVPVRIHYGEQDRALPDVARTMARVARDLPQAVTSTWPDCGHFLQEERPEELGELLAAFFTPGG